MAQTGTAWLLSLGWLAWALLRTSGGDRAFPLVPAVSFTPYVLGLAWIPILTGLLARSWPTTALAVAASVLLVAAVVPRTRRSPAGGADGSLLTVGSLNLLHGRADPGAVRAHAVGLDVLLLQELTEAGLDALLAAGLGADFPHRIVDTEPGTSYGGAVFSRLPATALPAVPGGFRQPRAAVTLPDGSVLIVTSVHLWPPSTSAAHVRQWHADLAALPTPAPLSLLGGDFNATLDHSAFRALLRRGWTDAGATTGRGLVRTWYAGRLVPGLTIDHVLVPRGVAVAGYDVRPVSGSDHRFVTVALRFP
ncbi:MAG: endonuclease/exonuclease/phosphatase family protein [Geodermatophilaceae bacterium]|nr:endonuclease/exonuclease/phosphatase family protein [Geodermatophilaceae bacterium]